MLRTISGCSHISSTTRPTKYCFSENTAAEQGYNLFGGLLDRCSLSGFSVVTRVSTKIRHSGVTFLENISNIERDSIASLPISVCFCNSEGKQDCNYQLPPIEIKKGEQFTVLIVAVDQVNNALSANVISFLASPDGGLGEDQHNQRIGTNCTNLTFSVFSPHDHERIVLYADGPCGSSTPSVQYVNILFLNCTCPVGFKASDGRLARCECDCDPEIYPHITNCNYTTGSVLRENTYCWISYIYGRYQTIWLCDKSILSL